MKIKEKKDWAICRTDVELSSFDRFTIAQTVNELTQHHDEVEHCGIVIPSPLYENIVTLLVKLAGRSLCEQAVSNVFVQDKDYFGPKPEMPEQELQKMDV